MKPEFTAENENINYNRKWHVMSAVGTGVFLATLDGSIINVSLPTLVRELNTQFSIVQWVVLSYLLTVTSTMAAIGRFADMVGKKKIYMTGFFVFTIGSALCGFSPSVEWLIGFRVIQAIGASMMMALGAAIVTEAFPPAERGKAMGIIGSIVSVGIVLGPALGGVIISLLSWRWIFYVNFPVGLLGMFIVFKNVPQFTPKGRQQFDIMGALTMGSGILCLALGLTFGQQQGFYHPSVYSLLISSLGLLIIFIIVERRVSQPMIDPGLFKNRIFTVSLTTGFISFVSLGGTMILLPFYLENILGLPAMKVGLLMGIVPVMLGITSPVSGILSDKIGSKIITMTGLFVMLAGFIAASTLNQETTLIGYALRIFAVGAGIGIFISPNNSAIMGSASKKQLGIVSGMMAQSRTLGQTVGVAVIGAIWAGRTIFYARPGINDPSDISAATQMPVQAQIGGMHDAFLTAAGLIIFALALSLLVYLKKSNLPENKAK